MVLSGAPIINNAGRRNKWTPPRYIAKPGKIWLTLITGESVAIEKPCGGRVVAPVE